MRLNLTKHTCIMSLIMPKYTGTQCGIMCDAKKHTGR